METTTKVYIGHLPEVVTRRDIERILEGYGDIIEIKLKQGYGFVELTNERDAKDVVYNFHGRKFEGGEGGRLVVELARGPRINNDDNNASRRRRLVVGNIARGTNWQDLKDLMRKAGEVIFADISRSRPSEGLVEFGRLDDMEYALKRLNDRELNGQRITLRRDTGRSTHRSRSRSKSRSRSPSHRRKRALSESRSHRRSSVRSRSASRSRSPPSKRPRRGSSDNESREKRVKTGAKSSSRSPVKSPVGNEKSSAPRDD